MCGSAGQVMLPHSIQVFIYEGGVLLVFVVTGLLIPFLVLRAVYFDVLGNQIYTEQI